MDRVQSCLGSYIFYDIYMGGQLCPNLMRWFSFKVKASSPLCKKLFPALPEFQVFVCICVVVSETCCACLLSRAAATDTIFKSSFRFGEEQPLLLLAPEVLSVFTASCTYPKCLSQTYVYVSTCTYSICSCVCL